eukprot:scaffold1724_cov246-Pinguiococcus_pyrenoidosus.AAC.27
MQGAWAKGKPRIVRDEPAVSSAPQGPPNSQRRQNGHKAPKGQKGVQSRQKREAAPQRPQQRPRETPLPPQQQQGQPAVQPPLAPAPAPVVARPAVNYPPSTAPPVNEHLEDALKEAVEGARERVIVRENPSGDGGGIPIGCVLTYVGDDGVERVVSRGRNKRVQDRSATRTAVIDCLENAGRQKVRQRLWKAKLIILSGSRSEQTRALTWAYSHGPIHMGINMGCTWQAHVYKRCAIYVTTAPEMLSAGAIKLYGIPKVRQGMELEHLQS